jgi:hypothetical protein
MQTSLHSSLITKQGTCQPMPAFWYATGTSLISNLREDSVGCSG